MTRRSPRRVLILAALAAVVLEPAPAPASEAVALVGGEVHPVSGATIPGGTVIFRGERIVAVGRDLPIPKDAQVVDCSGKWITPGLVESFTTLGLVEVSAERPTVDFMAGIRDPVRASLSMADALDRYSSLLPVARRHGVTAAVAVPHGGLIAGQAVWVDLAAPDPARVPDAPTVGMHAFLGEQGSAASGGSRARALALLREALDDARTYQKNRAAYLRRALFELSVSRLDLEALLAVINRRVPLIFSVSRASDILLALDFAEAEKVNIVLAGAEEGWIVADALAKKRVPVILDPMINVPHKFESKNARADNATLLARAGVPLAVSTFSGHNAGNLRFALANAVRAGLPRDVALRAGTLTPAEIFGRAREVGALERGKRADIVVWSGDPFEPAHAAEAVYIAGRPEGTETRQTRLARRYIQRLGLAR